MTKAQLRVLTILERHAGQRVEEILNIFMMGKIKMSLGYTQAILKQLCDDGVISNRCSNGTRTVTILATGEQIKFSRKPPLPSEILAAAMKYHAPTWICPRDGVRNEHGKPSRCGHQEPRHGLSARIAA
jgi:hypothetical protein